MASPLLGTAKGLSECLPPNIAEQDGTGRRGGEGWEAEAASSRRGSEGVRSAGIWNWSELPRWCFRRRRGRQALAVGILRRDEKFDLTSLFLFLFMNISK